MKTALFEALVDMAKGINPKQQNLLDKETGESLTSDGEEVVHTTVAIVSKLRSDDVVFLTHTVDSYLRPNLNIFGLMDYSHRVAFNADKAKSGHFVLETDADLTYDKDKLLAPSVYAERLDLFLSKCGIDAKCDVQVKKNIRTWADIGFVLVEEDTLGKNKEGKSCIVKKDELMLLDGGITTEQSLLEAQLLKLRPKFNTELFCEYSKEIYTRSEIILWAKSKPVNVTANSVVKG